LDNIVLKAMRKLPRRRYYSAEQLAEDIERHLSGMPVTARADTVWYRSAKFVKRHRRGVAVASVALLLVVMGGAVSYSQWQRAGTLLHTNQDAMKTIAELQLQRPLLASRMTVVYPEGVTSLAGDIGTSVPENEQRATSTIAQGTLFIGLEHHRSTSDAHVAGFGFLEEEMSGRFGMTTPRIWTIEVSSPALPLAAWQRGTDVEVVMDFTCAETELQLTCTVSVLDGRIVDDELVVLQGGRALARLKIAKHPLGR
jgi:hypothetical protein